MEDGDEADDEDNDTADMLEDDSRVGNEGPKVVWFKSGISLEVFEKRRLICIIIGICDVSINSFQIWLRD